MSQAIEQAIAAAMALIRTRDYVTYVELETAIRPFIATAGDRCQEIAPNAVLWAGMSAEFCTVVNALQASKDVTAVPASVLTYLIDGRTLTFPTVKRFKATGYATPRWIPVCFRPAERVSPPRRRRG
jgi:hypothetical protein